MKKLILSLLMAVLLLTVLLLPANAETYVLEEEGQRIAAAADAITFPTDGTVHTAVCPVCGKSVTWKPLTAAGISGGFTLVKATHYYLVEDIQAAGVSITGPGSVSHISCMHLNGKKLINTSGVAIAGSAGTLNIMGQGQVQGAGNSGAAYAATMHINTGGTKGNISLYGGTYSKLDTADTENVIAIRNNGGTVNLYSGAKIIAGTGGSAVYMWGGMAYVNATFNMYGGTIDASASNEAAIDMAEVADGKINVSSVNLYGGTITGGAGSTGGSITVRKNAILNLYGGTVQNGKATSGGNVYLAAGSVCNMYGGTVTGGQADNGGNLYLSAGAALNVYGGKITDGQATAGEGGNIYAKGDNESFAAVTLRNVEISGGTSSSNGGNLSVLRTDLTIGDGTRITDGTAGGRAGSLRAYQSVVIMNGGYIGGGTSNYSSANRPHDVWLAGASSTRLCKMYMLGGIVDSNDACVGSAVTAGANSQLYLAGNAGFTSKTDNDEVYVTGKLFVCDGWTGEASVRINSYYSNSGTVDPAYGAVVTLQDDLNCTAGGRFTGKLRQGPMAISYTGGSLKVSDTVLVNAAGVRTAASDPMTDWETGAYQYLELYGDQTLEIPENTELWVDLRGFDLTVTGSGTVHAFDSANDTYKNYGSLTNNGTVTVAGDVAAPNGNRYIALTEGAVTTMHRLDLQVTAVTLRTAAAGIYYKAAYNCDDTLAAKVSSYGVALSVFDMPGADFTTETKDINQYTVGSEPFKGGLVTTSGSVFGILEEGRTADNNSKRGQIRIYANPYILLEEQVLVGDNKNPGKTADEEDFDGVALSLRDAMELADGLYFDYDRADQKQLCDFFAQWQGKGMDWQLPNMGAERIFADSDLLDVTQNYCDICQKTVTWQAVTQEAYGAVGIGAMADGSHYYLAEDITYGGSDYFVLAPVSGSTGCLHLNGHTVMALDSVVVQGYSGRINVMGSGTVCGNATDDNKGAAVQINTAGKNGQIHLYGGTYTKLHSNKTASVVASWNGGKLYLHEGVHIRGTGEGPAVYGGEATAAAVHIGIDGARVTGGEVRVAAPDAEAGFGSSLTIGGKAQLEEVALRSAAIATTLSGAPKIDRLALVSNALLKVQVLSHNARIAVSCRGVFTEASDSMARYAACFTPWVETDKLVLTEENTLRYDIDYERYMTPYIRDVRAEAIADGKIHYYFMAGEGMIMSPTTTGELDKWGDSCLIVFPNGQTMLVDTGYAVQQPVIAGSLKRMGVTELDFLLITHPHSDHQGAFYSPWPFFDEIQVAQVYHNPLVVSNSDVYGLVEELCAARNIPCTGLKQGAQLDFGAVHMEVLWPAAGTENTAISSGKINDHSMVFRLDYGDHSSLFTGDIYELAEGQILNAVDNSKLDVDFLKIPHHGWNTSSSEAFVNAVAAKLAVATGRVVMPETYWNRYTAAGTQVLMDLYHGYIHVEADSLGEMTYETSR